MIRHPRPSGWRLLPALPMTLAALLFTGQPASATPAPPATRSTAIEPRGHSGGASGNDSTPRYDWQLVWRDDFDGRARSPIDTSAWLHDVGTCYPGCPAANWGTGEIAEATASRRNVALDGRGHLLITPVRDSADPAKWTTGRVETRRADFRAEDGGALRVEARIALPTVSGASAQGLWSAFWMLGSTFRDGYKDVTGAGDIDIMEHVNADPEIVGAAHCSPPTGDPCNEVPDNVGLAGKTPCPPAGCLRGFHTYGVELHREATPQRVDWTVDGAVYHSISADQRGMDEKTWNLIVDRSFFIILNLSVGGSWPGPPTADTASGVPLVVDFVAVWKFARKPSTPSRSGRHGDDCTGRGHSHGDEVRRCTDEKGSRDKEGSRDKKGSRDKEGSRDEKGSPDKEGSRDEKALPIVRRSPTKDDERTQACGHPRHA